MLIGIAISIAFLVWVGPSGWVSMLIAAVAWVVIENHEKAQAALSPEERWKRCRPRSRDEARPSIYVRERSSARVRIVDAVLRVRAAVPAVGIVDAVRRVRAAVLAVGIADAI